MLLLIEIQTFIAPFEGLLKVRIPRAAANAALDQIEPPPQVGEAGDTRQRVEHHDAGEQRGRRVKAERQPIGAKDRAPPGREKIELRPE